MNVRILGNVDECRTEAEIFDESENTVAVVYENSHGWQTKILDKRMREDSSVLATAVEQAKEVLSHYVNRRGENPPEDMTVGALSLWLMVKDDGTMMGMKV